jgi:hypothetical protein
VVHRGSLCAFPKAGLNKIEKIKIRQDQALNVFLWNVPCRVSFWMQVGWPAYVINPHKNRISRLMKGYTTAVYAHYRAEVVRKVYALTHQKARALRVVFKYANVHFMVRRQEPETTPKSKFVGWCI